jgi:hypothetical protein
VGSEDKEIGRLCMNLNDVVNVVIYSFDPILCGDVVVLMIVQNVDGCQIKDYGPGSD